MCRMHKRCGLTISGGKKRRIYIIYGKKPHLKANFQKQNEKIITHEYLPPIYQLRVKIKRLAVPQKEETAEDETKIENADRTLYCNVHHGQRNPVDMLEYKNLENSRYSSLIEFVHS